MGGTAMTNFHNTLYVKSEGAYVAKNGESVVVRVGAFVAGKIANSRAVLQRALRDRPQRDGAAAVGEAIDHLGRLGPGLLAKHRHQRRARHRGRRGARRSPAAASLP